MFRFLERKVYTQKVKHSVSDTLNTLNRIVRLTKVENNRCIPDFIGESAYLFLDLAVERMFLEQNGICIN